MTKNSNEFQTYKINLGFQPSNINSTVTSIVRSSAGSLRICLSPRLVMPRSRTKKPRFSSFTCLATWFRRYSSTLSSPAYLGFLPPPLAESLVLAISTNKPRSSHHANISVCLLSCLNYILITRMHSSRIRTIRCSARLWTRGVCPAWCLPRAVSCHNYIAGGNEKCVTFKLWDL